jgi:hypothetical protein
MNINASRLIKLAALILLVAAVYYAAGQFAGRRGKPACAGLACYTDDDCGSACHCELTAESKSGKCAAK